MGEINQEAASISIPQGEKPLTGERTKKIIKLLNLAFDNIQSKRKNFQASQILERLNFRNLKLNKKNLLWYLILTIILMLVLFGGIGLINQISPSSPKSADNNSLKISGPISSKKLNKEYKFSLKNEKGEEIAKFSYIIESAELRKEILIKGQKATAVKGRIFFILNLKFINTLKQGINVNARDYIRLMVNNSKELLAPDIHNDPVEVQAISTKYTRVGFAINETDKSLKLQVGEIEGKKEIIPLEFK